MWFHHALYQPTDYVAHAPSTFIPHHTHFLETISLTVVVQSGTS